MYSLRLASGTSSTGLGRFGGKRSGGPAPAPAQSLVPPAAAVRGSRGSVSATSNAAAPVPGDQGRVGMEQRKQQQQPQPPRHDAAASVTGDQGRVGMEQGKQQQPQPPRHDAAAAAAAGEQQGNNTRDDNHEITGHLMSRSFGEGYSTRSDEEGFGGVYGGNDEWQFNPGTQLHPSHPDYDTTQGSEVKEKEKARNLKDDN